MTALRFLAVLMSLIVPQAAFAGNDIAHDPWEGMNRKIYSFNQSVDRIVTKPIAKGYRYITPQPARSAIHRAFINLSEPVTFANAAFQLDLEQSLQTFWRFAINSTVGIGGLFDVAKHIGFTHQKEDFGQTLGHYGVGAGPYIMLPILGPSNARDSVGFVADIFTDPVTYLHDYARIGINVGRGIDTREQLLDPLDDIEATSLDSYATIRSLYTQRRWADIKE